VSKLESFQLDSTYSFDLCPASALMGPNRLN
jgi:hypothetical protein